VDDRTIRIVFSEPKPFPYTALVGSESPIIQAKQFENCLGARAPECTEQNFNPIGTGPFRVTEFRANDVITLEANPNYREPNKPAFATVLFKGGGDAESAARAVLQTGEFDYAWNLQISPEVLSEMEAAGKGTVVRAFATSVERIHVNFTNPDPALGPDERSVWKEDGSNPHPILSDYKVRRALSKALDPVVLTEIGYGENGRPTCNVRLDRQRRVPGAGHGGGQAPARRGRLGSRPRRRARQGRPAPVAAVPDLDQRGAAGIPGHHQGVVGRDRRRDRAAQHLGQRVLRRRPGEPGHLPEVLRRRADVHEQLQRR
jgi:ABC-type transport system substrate-binding protein